MAFDGAGLSLSQIYDRTRGYIERALIERLSIITGDVLGQAGGITGSEADDSPEIQTALSGNIHRITLPEGVYSAKNLNIAIDGDDIRAPFIEIIGQGNVQVNVPATSGAYGLQVSKRRFLSMDGVRFISTGTKNDGLNTVGLKFAGNNARFEVNRCYFEGFSYAAIQCIQSLASSFGRNQIYSCGRGYSFEKNGSVVPTSVTMRGGYISGCTRGIFGDNLVGGDFTGMILEECGSSSTTDGAVHFLAGTRDVNFYNLYFEASNRNFVLTDARMAFPGRGPRVGTPAGADVITWSGVANVDRGIAELTSNRLGIRNIGPDLLGGFDLNIGDIVVPLAGGATRFGALSAPQIVSYGPTTSATWTTIKTFAAGEFSGTGGSTGGAARNAYLLFIYCGETDLSKFSGLYVIDTVAGTPTITKVVGTTETANIRMSSLDLQINVTDAQSYGRRGKYMLLPFGPLG